MIQMLLYYLLRSLLLTVIWELAGAFALGIRASRDAVIVALSQLVTNPAVVAAAFFLNLRIGASARIYSLALLEPLAVVIEGFIYKRTLNFKKINPYLLSLACNTLSFVSGELINIIF